MNIKPIGARVLVKTLEQEEVTKGGIVLPDTAKEKPQEGEVISVGPGAKDESGKRIAMDVKKGDKVLYSKYSGTEVKINGEEHLIIRESDVLAIIE